VNNTFHKNERLCSKKQIDVLFEKGQTLSAYPIKIIFLERKNEAASAVMAMFVVPKKKFKHANDRNKLKRRMRESYRLQKNEFYNSVGGAKLDLALLYYGNKTEEYDTIFKAISKLLNNLTKQISTGGK
jgi:ribonuclease P protein component